MSLDISSSVVVMSISSSASVDASLPGESGGVKNCEEGVAGTGCLRGDPSSSNCVIWLLMESGITRAQGVFWPRGRDRWLGKHERDFSKLGKDISESGEGRIMQGQISLEETYLQW